ncbi:MAG: hypothetical protein ACRD3T_02380 [Terriglobia bacterium]
MNVPYFQQADVRRRMVAAVRRRPPLEIGIEAVYPKPNLSQRGEGHQIYPYLLRGLEVERAD